MYRVALRVVNVNVFDSDTVRIIEGHGYLKSLYWEFVDGRTYAVLHCEERPVEEALHAARTIRQVFAESVVESVDEDLVSITDIANRLKRSREAVRLWVHGDRGPGGFPAAVGSIGSGTKVPVQVWFWPTVNAWLEKNFQLGDGFQYLSRLQTAQLVVGLLSGESTVEEKGGGGCDRRPGPTPPAPHWVDDVTWSAGATGEFDLVGALPA